MSDYPEKMNGEIQAIHTLQSSGLDTYAREVSSGCGATITVEGRESINFISNSYLGFSLHPKVIEASRTALKKYGMGTGGSPAACGTTSLHLKLAERIAANYGKESAIIFASGYQALAGTIQGFMDRKSTALLDALDHRSIIDGCVLSGCKVRSYAHNDMQDLERLLESTATKPGFKMVIVDSVYSMDGDIAPLPDIRALTKKFNAGLLLDEAHSLGILGRSGKGLLEHFNLFPDSEIVSGTFSKFAGAVGGFAAASKDVIDFLRFYSSPFVFSASIPPAVVAAVDASFDLLQDEPQWLDRLWDNARYMLQGLKDLGFDTGHSSTPVIPVMIRDTQKTLVMNRMLLDQGVFASPVVHPGVPLRKERLRLGIMATHTRKHLDKALEIFQFIGKKLEVIE